MNNKSLKRKVAPRSRSSERSVVKPEGKRRPILRLLATREELLPLANPQEAQVLTRMILSS